MTGSRVERNATNFGPAPEAALLAAVVGLAGFGLVMIHSTTSPMADHGILGVSPHFVRHLAALAAAASGAWLVSQMPLRFWRLIALPFWAGSIVLLAFTLLAGVEVNGARRWLPIPGIGVRFQPAEMAKVATVLAVAALCARSDARPTSPSRLWAPALLALIPAGLLIRQPDLGNAVVVVMLTCSLLFVAGTPLRVFTLPAVVGTLLVGAYVFTTSYAWKRLTGFLDPWAHSDAEGFQLVQSFVGFARGGLTGVGIGDGRQKLHYLPEAHTDFILAVVAEEAGFLGVLAVLGAFAALVIAGLQVARRAQDRFAMLLAFGATMLLALPAVLNAAVVTGSVPPKGLPLPFLSYGRTALVAAFFAAGLLIAVARQAPAETQRFRK